MNLSPWPWTPGRSIFCSLYLEYLLEGLPGPHSLQASRPPDPKASLTLTSRPEVESTKELDLIDNCVHHALCGRRRVGILGATILTAEEEGLPFLPAPNPLATL